MKGGEETNLSCRRIPNRLPRYSPLRRRTTAPHSGSVGHTEGLPAKGDGMAQRWGGRVTL